MYQINVWSTLETERQADKIIETHNGFKTLEDAIKEKSRLSNGEWCGCDVYIQIKEVENEDMEEIRI